MEMGTCMSLVYRYMCIHAFPTLGFLTYAAYTILALSGVAAYLWSGLTGPGFVGPLTRAYVERGACRNPYGVRLYRYFHRDVSVGGGDSASLHPLVCEDSPATADKTQALVRHKVKQLMRHPRYCSRCKLIRWVYVYVRPMNEFISTLIYVCLYP
jgi:hypothetical protein